MALINLTGALLSPGPITLLDRVSLGLHPGERLGLVGRNGAGKSSLLRVLHGTQALDAGERKVATGLRIGHMAQNPSNQGAATVFDSVAAELSSARQARAALEVCTDARELASLHAQVEALDAWRWEDRAREVISRVGLSESARIADLSGGAQRRLALASCLVTQPDVLLLDEPTNHLDLDAIVWLETWLRGFRGAMVVVSHDRSFLDAVCNSVVEVDRGRLHRYEGDFSSYLIQREARWAQEAVEQAKADRLLAAEEVWIRQGVEARRTRAQARIKRLDDLREQRAQRRQRAGQARLEIQRGAIGGQVVASLESASFAYGPTQSNAPLVDALDLIVLRGDKLAIVGPNGSGKTTLIRLLLGELLPTQGHVHHGTRLRIAYFDQMRDGIAPDTTLATFLQPDGDWIDLPSGKVHVRRYLADFLFDPQRAHHRIETLSGGERARLMLARLFAQPANLLVLDEPTNDLDIDTIELLEERLAAFDGTVILVSHDRRFLDNVATSVLAFEGPGRWIGYEGNVTDWLTQAARRVATTPPPADTPRPVATPEAPARAPSKTKLSYREQREFDDLPGRIEALEADQASITEELAKGTVYSADPARAADLAARHEAIEHELMQALERWEALDSRAKN